jgi:UDP-3-O-[3-hydroxymyristoyl] glucosamine N-acyltransferase
MPISLGDLATRFGCELIGDPDIVVSGVATLANATNESLTFLASSAYKKQLSSTKAAAVILRPADAAEAPVAALLHENPYACYARMAAFVCPEPAFEPGIHASAVVDPSANIAASAHVGAQVAIGERVTIGESVYIGPGTVIGPDCIVGDDCRLIANVTFARAVHVGKRSIFHPGAVLGSDGFGHALTPEGWVRVPQLGGLRIGDDVEIGANTTVDCGAIDDTVIEDGVRIDNLCQIGHNVHVGAHTAMASSVAIAGSTKIGKRCQFAGLVASAGHLQICDDVVALGRATITKDITEPGTYGAVFAAEPAREWARHVARFKRIDALTERVRKLEKK